MPSCTRAACSCGITDERVWIRVRSTLTFSQPACLQQCILCSYICVATCSCDIADERMGSRHLFISSLLAFFLLTTDSLLPTRFAPRGFLTFLRAADEKNGIRCTIQFSAQKGLPSDYLEGYIEKYDVRDSSKEGSVLCSVEGSWIGYVDFDQVRFWDIRTAEKMTHYAPSSVLPSDSRKRGDRNALAANDYTKAQAEKIALEEQQRAERKLRKQDD